MQLLSTFLNINYPEKLLMIEETIQSSMPLTIYCVDKSNRILLCNQTQASFLGLACPKDAINYSIFDVMGYQEADHIKENNLKITYTEAPEVFYEPCSYTRSRKQLSISLKKPVIKAKKVIGVMGVSIVLPASTSRHDVNTEQLTNKQWECFQYIIRGFPNKIIARKMSISHRTVEHHVEAIKEKLQCKTRFEIISKYSIM